ncbi:hypothetical protein KFK09_001306 [Dendrobium nobile]|uniref:Pentatricopeptide repeat-containing protein n=1 Tax=Dendrobium nobile TaxID=94219 RepID=A0A8T3C7T5_DENNO|nr:hypothetical protein KFK09_001306 [Dendrobium nobile]
MAIRSCDCSPVRITRQKSSKAPIAIYHSRLFSVTFPSSSPRSHLVLSSKSSPSLLQDASKNLQIPSSSPLQLTPPLPDLRISNEFIDSLCQNPQTESLAFCYYQKATAQPGFELEPQTLKLVLKTLVRNRQWSSISAIAKDFLLLEGFPDKISCCKLISSCIRARKFKLVEFLLGVLECKKDVAVPTYSAVMNGYNKLHMYRSTVSVFDRMISVGVSPDAKCYYLIMEAHRKLRNADMVLSLFLKFISEKKERVAASVHIYYVLCDSLGRSGRAVEALRYFREMIEKRIPPTPSIYSSLICSFAGIREAEIAWDLYSEAKAKGLVRDPDMFLKLVLMYVDLGLLEKTVEIVEEMVEMKMKVTDCILCAVINGYTKKRGLWASMKSYEKLKSLGCEPGQVTYASIINVYCRLGLYPDAENTFVEMLERGFDRCVVAYSNIISMYGKNGRDRDATKLFAKMKEKGCEPNVWVYNSLLDMHGRLLNIKQVDKLWKEMKRRGIAPDKVSYTSIICAYSKARQFEECIKFYDQYKMNGGKADKALAGIMVGVFSKINKIDYLVKLLNDLKMDGMRFDGRLYKSALNALRDSGLLVHVKWLEENFSFEIEMEKT